jgi:hypothetical protein
MKDLQKGEVVKMDVNTVKTYADFMKLMKAE